MTKDLASRMREYAELDGKRTQGCLEVHKKRFGQIVIRTVDAIKDNGTLGHIAHISPHPGIKWQECQANANFIASSPSIYADAALMFGLLKECYEQLITNYDELREHGVTDYELMELADKLKQHGLTGEVGE